MIRVKIEKLEGEEAEKLDLLVDESLKEYNESKTKIVNSLDDLY